MSRRAFHEILDACIEDVAAGRRSVAECLATYPEHREELEPLLEAVTAVQLLQVPEPQPDPERRARFMAELRRTPQRRRSRLPRLALPTFGAFGGGLSRMVAVAAPAAAIAVVAVLLTLARGPAPAAAASLTVFAGGVEQQRDGRWLPLADGAELAEGAHLRTAADGLALIVFADGSTAALDPATELVLERLRIDAGTRVVTIDQRSGRIWNDVVPDARAGSAYAVRTPDALVEALGTVFETTVTEGRTAVATAEGRVSVRTTSESVEVARGETVVVRAQQIAAQALARAAEVRVDAPFVASLVAEHGAATGARVDGTVFRQLAGVSTSDPGEGAQLIDLVRAAPGVYTLLLDRFAEGEGEVVLETTSGRQVIALPERAVAVGLRVRVSVEGGQQVVELLGRDPVAERDAAVQARVAPTKRDEQATPVAEQRRRAGAAGRGEATPEATRTPLGDLADRVRELLTPTARPATTATPVPADRPESRPTEQPQTMPSPAVERVAQLLAALEAGDRQRATEHLRELLAQRDAEAIEALRRALIDDANELVRERLRQLIEALPEETRELLRPLLEELLPEVPLLPATEPAPLPTRESGLDGLLPSLDPTLEAPLLR